MFYGKYNYPNLRMDKKFYKNNNNVKILVSPFND